MRRKRLLFIMLITIFAVSMIAVGCSGSGDKPLPEGEETGMYYYAASNGDYLLTLNSGNRFTLFADGATKSGTYVLEGDSLELEFTDKEEGKIAGSYSGTAINLIYKELPIEFLKMIDYSVTFDCNGGDPISSQTVLNGGLALRPLDPVREGYTFVGWYSDKDCTMPFMFDTERITDNVTVYAGWVLSSSQSEYEIGFDLGYGDSQLDSRMTIGGKLYNAYLPTRDGYVFGGWWMSDYDDIDKLTTKYSTDTVFTENTVLFAVWHDSGEKPLELKIDDKMISWEGTIGAQYELSVKGPEGETKETLQQTSKPFDFSQKEAGDYIVTLTSTLGGNETRYYRNKGLNRVSIFNVSPSNVLFFNGVSNAQKYRLTIVCGDKNHMHELLDLGTNTSYDFGNCPYGESGITFTVTAEAEGYLSSGSEPFTYVRRLDKVENLSVSDATQTLTFDAVPFATEYIVSVSCGNPSHDHSKKIYTSSCSVSLKECTSGADGKIKVEVSARAKGFISSEPAKIEYEKTTLPTPSNVRISAEKVRFDKVANAEGYSLRFESESFSEVVKIALNENISTQDKVFEYQLQSSLVEKLIGNNLTMRIMTNSSDSARESLWSDPIAISLKTMGTPEYSHSVVRWQNIVSVLSYEVKVNDGAPEEILSSNEARVTFDQAGVNTISVRAKLSDEDYTLWSSVNVYAYAVSFDSVGGNEIEPIYLAKGDIMALPTPQKTNYEFVGWYNLIGGGAANGKNYSTDEFFEENGDLSLYAYWKPAEYTVNLNFQRNSSEIENCKDQSGNLITAYKVPFGESFSLPVPLLSDKSFVFAGWFTYAGGAGRQIADELGNSIAAWSTANNDTTLYAYFVQALVFDLSSDGKTYSVKASDKVGGDKIREIDKIKNVVIPYEYNGRIVSAIDGYAFKGADKLISINIPDSISLIECSTVFDDCTMLEAVNIYGTGSTQSPLYGSNDGILYQYGTEQRILFVPLAKKGNVSILDGTKVIPYNVFNGSGIESVTIPSSVKIIYSQAFSACASLTDIDFEFGGNVELTIEDRAFEGCAALTELIFPARLSSIDPTAVSGCVGLTSIGIEGGSDNFATKSGVLYDKDFHNLVIYPMGNEQADYAVQNGTQTIGAHSFEGARFLKTVTVPSTVITIAESAFIGCTQLSAVVFDNMSSSRLRTIGASAFATSALTSINLPPRLTEIGASAFEMTSLKEISLPDGVKEISERAFFGSKELTQISFSSNVTKIGKEAFRECSALATINFNGTKSAWSAIEKGDNWAYRTSNALTVIFPDGTSINAKE